MNENLLNMMSDPQVIMYFAALLVSMGYCFVKTRNKWQVVGSLGAMSLTWFYICRWMVEYKLQGGDNMFDDAYIDTARPPHWKASSQLLTWVVVGSVWMHEANPCYMIFGMLGAMSAAFLCWVPNMPIKSGASIPVTFVATSCIDIYCIYKLPRSIATSTEDFAFWLKLLHVVLVFPQLLSPVASFVPKVHGSVVYCSLALAICAGHWAEADPTTTLYTFFTMPETDCQLSITFDLVLCSIISLYGIYQQTHSARTTFVCAVLMFILSPGSVLAGFLAVRSMLCDPNSLCSYANVVTSLQQHAAVQRMKRQCGQKLVEGQEQDNNAGLCLGLRSSKTVSKWMNLGAWGVTDSEEGYAAACERLADILGGKVFNRPATQMAGDCVLACGCGYGAELSHWKQSFSLCHITGIDTNDDAVNRFASSPGVRLLRASVGEIVPLFGEFRSGASFNKIVALDCIYHFPDKVQFFRDCAKVLGSFAHTDKGRGIGFTDIVLKDEISSADELPWWVTVALSMMNVHSNSLWNSARYRSELLASGWEAVDVETVSVLEYWLPAAFLRYLNYAVISAKLPADKSESAINRVSRPKVAVIGSGLAGLTAARLLSSTHCVTVFEAKEAAGLSGQGVQVGDQFVDIPLRIIGQGYYSYVQQLTRSLGVTVRPIREADFLTQFNYGTSSPLFDPDRASAQGSFDFSNSWMSNAWAALPHLADLKRFNQCVYRDKKMKEKDSLSSSGEGGRCETWGEWMARHNYDTSRYLDGASREGGNTPKEGDSFIMWLLMGSASWMLSTTYAATLRYPAHIILGFAKSLRWGEDVADVLYSSASKAGRMMRVKPSMQALENALTYGLDIRCGTPVRELSGEKVINGERFEAVVVATEAAAVKHIMAPSALAALKTSSGSTATEENDVFARVQYQSSSIYVHRDDSLMPSNKRDWRTFNMRQDFGFTTCSLTAWLNDYYPEAKFSEGIEGNDCGINVFQTWNPYKLPSPDLTIKVSHFQRVVHTADTPKLLSDIAAAQGKIPGIFFAGAYTFPGMGLLEQAARSGKRAADMVQETAATASTASVARAGPVERMRSPSRIRSRSPASSRPRKIIPSAAQNSVQASSPKSPRTRRSKEKKLV